MWYYNDEVYDPEVPPEGAVGFVYRVQHLETGRKYLGKKLLWSRRKTTVKGKKKYVTKESDWRTYYGSSKQLQEEIKENGNDKYHREILRLCETKGEMSYYEAKYQFDNDVLLSDEYYNEFIGCKIHSKHLKRTNNGSK
jgi:hypothetical protein